MFGILKTERLGAVVAEKFPDDTRMCHMKLTNPLNVAMTVDDSVLGMEGRHRSRAQDVAVRDDAQLGKIGAEQDRYIGEELGVFPGGDPVVFSSGLMLLRVSSAIVLRRWRWQIIKSRWSSTFCCAKPDSSCNTWIPADWPGPGGFLRQWYVSAEGINVFPECHWGLGPFSTGSVLDHQHGL